MDICTDCPKKYYCDDMCLQALRYFDKDELPKDYYKFWEDSKTKIVKVDINKLKDGD